MNDLIEELLRFLTLNPNLGLMVSALLTSSAVVSAAWALALQLRNRSARARTCVWRITLVMLLAVGAWRLLDFSPPMAVVEWQVPMPVVVETVPMLPQQSTIIVLPERPWWRQPVAWAEDHGVTVWLSVASAWMLWRVVGALTGLFLLRKHSVEAPERICRLADAMGAPTAMNYRLAQRLHSPMLTGWRKATIWLPQEAADWTELRLRAVLRHELAHHEGADVPWHWLGLVTTSLWWWQPLTWLAVRKLRSETEQAADDIAVLSGASTHDYARTLVEIAAGIPTRLRHSAGVAMFGGESIQQRVRELMKTNRWRGRIGMDALSLIAVAAVILAVLAATRVEFKQRDPVYQSTAKLVAGGMMPGDFMEWREQRQDFYGTIIETIESAEMQRRALERVRALDPGLKEHAVAVHVTQGKGSAIFNVQAQSGDGKYAQIFLDALLDEFIAFRQAIRETAQSRGLQTFLQEVVKAQKEMEVKTQALEAFQRKNNMVVLTNAQNAAATFLEAITSQREKLRIEAAEMKLSLDSITDATAARGGQSGGSSGYLPMEPEASYLKTKNELFVLDNERRFLLQTQAPDHPEVRALDEKIAKAQFLLKSLAAHITEELQQRYDAIPRRMAVLDEQHAAKEQEVLELAGKLAEHERLEAAAQTAKEAYQKLFGRVETLQLNNTTADYVAIQERATPATPVVKNGLIPIWRLWNGENKLTGDDSKPETAARKKTP